MPASQKPVQLAHVAPPAPHDAAVVPARHCEPLQQPAQVPWSHRQAPASQYWPATHAAPPPQPQRPLLRHESVSFVTQLTQAAPDLPHSAGVGGVTQPPLASQQPLPHETGVQAPTHAPAVQLAPPPHAVHAAPPLPHAAGVVPAMHTPF